MPTLPNIEDDGNTVDEVGGANNADASAEAEVETDADDAGSAADDDDNYWPPDEVSATQGLPGQEQSAEELDKSLEDDVDDERSEESEDDPVENGPTIELVVTPLVKEELRAVSLPVNDGVGVFDQRFMPVRYGLSANETRSSSKRPNSRHLTIKFPEGLNQLFSGIWYAERGGMVYISFFARSDQDSRTGYKEGCMWKWFRIKPSNEVAIGLSRPYTLSRRDDRMVHDYDVGAFRLHLPHELESAEPGAVVHRRPMFG